MDDGWPASPIGAVGIVVAARRSEDVGLYVEIVDDRDGPTGGLYVLTWSGARTYDSWIEDAGELDTYFAEAGYHVYWLTDAEADVARQGRGL